jgi:Mor family transcriptional regulator
MNNVSIDDLHPTYRMIAQIIGIDNALKLGEELGGESIYFPKIDNCTSLLKERNRQIVSEYNGHNLEQLAKKHGLTTRRIREIIKKSKL